MLKVRQQTATMEEVTALCDDKGRRGILEVAETYRARIGGHWRRCERILDHLDYLKQNWLPQMGITLNVDLSPKRVELVLG